MSRKRKTEAVLPYSEGLGDVERACERHCAAIGQCNKLLAAYAAAKRAEQEAEAHYKAAITLALDRLDRLKPDEQSILKAVAVHYGILPHEEPPR